MDFLKKISPGLIGWLIGMIFPFCTLIFSVEYSMDGDVFENIRVLNLQEKLSVWITLVVLPNLFFFWFWIKKRKLAAARSILGATIFWALISLILKFGV